MELAERVHGLYLIKAAVDRVALVNDAVLRDTALSARVHFMDLPPMELVQQERQEPVQAEPSPSAHQLPYTFDHFSEGSSGLFYADALSLIRALQRCPLAVTVYQQHPAAPYPVVVGTARVRASEVLCDLINRALQCSSKHPLSDDVKGCFTLFDVDHVAVGTVSLTLRMVCFDKTMFNPSGQHHAEEDASVCPKCRLPRRRVDFSETGGEEQAELDVEQPAIEPCAAVQGGGQGSQGSQGLGCGSSERASKGINWANNRDDVEQQDPPTQTSLITSASRKKGQKRKAPAFRVIRDQSLAHKREVAEKHAKTRQKKADSEEPSTSSVRGRGPAGSAGPSLSHSSCAKLRSPVPSKLGWRRSLHPISPTQTHPTSRTNPTTPTTPTTRTNPGPGVTNTQ